MPAVTINFVFDTDEIVDIDVHNYQLPQWLKMEDVISASELEE